MASLAYELADRILDGQLAERITSQRVAGLSWDRIARKLETDTGAPISGETVRRWAMEAAA